MPARAASNDGPRGAPSLLPKREPVAGSTVQITDRGRPVALHAPVDREATRATVPCLRRRRPLVGILSPAPRCSGPCSSRGDAGLARHCGSEENEVLPVTDASVPTTEGPGRTGDEAGEEGASADRLLFILAIDHRASLERDLYALTAPATATQAARITADKLI